jgi:hypothetical protein
MLRWWQIMKFAVQPSTIFLDYSGLSGEGWKTLFANKNPFQIMYELNRFTMNTAAEPYNLKNVNVIAETQQVWRRLNRDLVFYWSNRFKELGSVLTMFGVKGLPIALDRRGLKDRAQEDARLATIDSFFQPPSLGVEPEMSKLGPFEAVYKGTYEETEAMSYLEIANHVKQFIGYEFFQQMDGNFWFKPPFYNVDVRAFAPVSIIEDSDVVNWSFGESESEVTTRLDVKGNIIDVDNTGGEAAPYGYHIDYALARQYGLRAEQATMQYLRDAAACRLYAIATLSRLNARVTSSSLSIVGRPELRLGYPVYVPSRDVFYYVTGITHSFRFGGPFQTTLTLEGRRAKRHSQGGELQKNAALILARETDPNRTTEGVQVLPETQTQKQEVVSKKGVAIIDGQQAGYWKEVVDYPLNQVTQEAIPVTDEEGYELVGGYPYGRDLQVTSQGEVEIGLGQRIAASEMQSLSVELDEEMLESRLAEGKNVPKWSDQAGKERYRQQVYLEDTLSDRSVGVLGSTLAELTPGEDIEKCTCTPLGTTFERYLLLISSGLAVPTDELETDRFIERARESAGSDREKLLSVLGDAMVKDENFMQDINNRLANPNALNDEQVSALKVESARAREHQTQLQRALDSLSGSPLDKPVSRDEVSDLVGE